MSGMALAEETYGRFANETLSALAELRGTDVVAGREAWLVSWMLAELCWAPYDPMGINKPEGFNSLEDGARALAAELDRSAPEAASRLLDEASLYNGFVASTRSPEWSAVTGIANPLGPRSLNAGQEWLARNIILAV